MYFILILSNFLKNKIILNFYQKKNIILNIKFLSKKELLWLLLYSFKSINKVLIKNKKINLFFINTLFINNTFNNISINFNKDFYVFIINYFIGLISINFKI